MGERTRGRREYLAAAQHAPLYWPEGRYTPPPTVTNIAQRTFGMILPVLSVVKELERPKSDAARQALSGDVWSGYRVCRIPTLFDEAEV